MDYLLYGTDRRLPHLAAYLHRAGHRVLSWEGIRGAHIREISSPLELYGAVNLVLPFRVKPEIVCRAVDSLPLQSRIFGGEMPKDPNFSLRLRRRALTWINLLEDEEFCMQNARLTAEGALHKLLECTPRAVSEECIAVTGSGRVARACADLLGRLGAEVLLVARNKNARRLFRREGKNALSLPPDEKEKALLGRVDAVLNTVPCEGVLDADFLGALRRGVPVLELASGNSNVDSDAARAREIPVFFLPALPAAIAPQSAAFLMFSAITAPKDQQ